MPGCPTSSSCRIPTRSPDGRLPNAAGSTTPSPERRSVVTLERKRPTDLEGRRKALSRRDGWLRRNSHAAIVVVDDNDPESDLSRQRFTEAIGDDVWDLDISTL